MRHGCLDAVFATTTLAAGVDFPARTVIITQSSIRKSRDFMDLTIGEVQQIAGRAGRRGKDLVGFAIVTPSPYIDLNVLTKGFTGQSGSDQQPIRHQLSDGPESLESPSPGSNPTDSRQKLCAISAQPARRVSGTQTGRSARSDGTVRAPRLHRLDHRVADLRPGPPAEISPAPPSEGTSRRKSPHAFTFSPPVVWWAEDAGRGMVSAAISQQGTEEPDDHGLRLGGGITESPAST